MAACDTSQSAMRKPPVNSPLIGNYSYTPSSFPIPRGTLTFADIQFPDTVNPLFSSSSVDLELQAALWGAPVIYDQHFHVHADELTEVPLPQNGDVLDNGKTIIMHLRHDLRWSDGQPILATISATGGNSIKTPRPARPTPSAMIRLPALQRLTTTQLYSI